MTTLPQVRQATIYPGQLGVWGSDVTRGLRWGSAGIVLYVNNIHPECHDDNDGTNPAAPLETIQQAVDNLVAWQTRYAADGSLSADGSVIVVAPSTYTENVIVPDPVLNGPEGCIITGGGVGFSAPEWDPAAGATTPTLELRAPKWRIENFRFRAAATVASIRLSHQIGAVADAESELTVIRNCYFDGEYGAGALYGIEFYGSPWTVTVESCRFFEHFVGATSTAIAVTSTGFAQPIHCVIRDNLFYDNMNHVQPIGGVGTFQVSFFTGNHFNTAGQQATTMALDLGLGAVGENFVVGNYLGGNYDTMYVCNTVNPGNWNGNFAEDTGGSAAVTLAVTHAPPV